MEPRGIRNNNPLNIRIGNNWQGEVDNPTDKDFEQFESIVWGIRAALILLRRYITRYHLVCVRDIITRWAPASENWTEKYVEYVSGRMGISPEGMIEWSNKKQIISLVLAMARYENGVEISEEIVRGCYCWVSWETTK